MGPQRASALGAFLASICMVSVAIAVGLDAKEFPTIQPVILFVCLVVSEVGGLIACFGVLGWMWHYPRSQAFIQGLSNATYQGSALIGALFKIMIDSGYRIWDVFLVLAATNLVASIG
eukprot:gnl/TRDRNA2_/TRDRNA2_154172_c1_seq2.p1 gnl/TRDRNA2_/TRDRNA2_154172_c1~~gnl/TRDRNA2_/TRDRNA2_154172_c1_seq2.p1  ORF type:complete len:138 (-),score=20.08 gnl/TRDRNA2_/TRDRNA2_154172_c1_seq2:79-432(-)